MKIWGTHLSSFSYTFSSLKKDKAEWTDPPGKHFNAGVRPDSFLPDLKSWATSFNAFGDWVNLSIILTLASNLETYLASVIRLAIESDPALVVGMSRAIDGTAVVKHRRQGAFDPSAHVDSCTKGDWSARIAAFRKIFGHVPNEMQDAHADLEDLRSIRNRFGHAFGREIEEARKHGVIAVPPMEKIRRPRVEALRKVVLDVSRSVDSHLSVTHIGDFEAVLFYMNLSKSIPCHLPAGQHAVLLKKAIGGAMGGVRGKEYCKELVEYWRSV